MTGRRWVLAAAALLVALVLGAAGVVRATVGLSPKEDLTVAERDAILAALQDGGIASSLTRPLPDQGPLVAVAWSDGRELARIEGRGQTLAEATRALASGAPDVSGRWQVILVGDRAPLVTRPALLSAFSLVPGLDGIGARFKGREVFVLADELVRSGLLASGNVIPMAGVPMGFDWPGAEALLAKRASLPAGQWALADKEFFRFRQHSFVQTADGTSTLPLLRGRTSGPDVTAENMMHAAKQGGRYLLDHLASNNRFIYEVNLATGSATNPHDPRAPYNLPRHAGVTWYLAQLYAAWPDPRLRAGLDRAVALLAELADEGRCNLESKRGPPMTCVLDRGHDTARLGSTALAAVALAEHRLATDDASHEALHRALLEFIVDMQLPEGRFTGFFVPTTGERNTKSRPAYYDGEAALALILGHRVFGDKAYLAAAERALDHLVDVYGFMGHFAMGADHWTCIAAEYAWPDLKHERYLDFCLAHMLFQRRQQVQPGDHPAWQGLAGAYAITPVYPPPNTPVASRTEAAVSTALLAQHHGRPAPDVRRQTLLSVKRLLDAQIRPEDTFWIRAANTLGAMPGGTATPVVRIDMIQHACTAILRARRLLASK